MSQRALSLPIRTLVSEATKSPSQWICRRCLSGKAKIPKIHTEKDFSQIPLSELFSKPLAQRHLPPQRLQYVDAERLPINEQEQWEKVGPHKKIVGVVVSHGKMDKTVRVRVGAQRWDKRIKKVRKNLAEC